MISHALLRSTVTNEIVFDQLDLHLASEFVQTMEHQALDTITFT